MVEDVWKDSAGHETYIPCTCPVCGKVFYPAVKEQWVFRRYIMYGHRTGTQSEHLFCSWGCMRKYDREFVPPVSHRGRKKKEVVTA